MNADYQIVYNEGDKKFVVALKKEHGDTIIYLTLDRSLGITFSREQDAKQYLDFHLTHKWQYHIMEPRLALLTVEKTE